MQTQSSNQSSAFMKTSENLSNEVFQCLQNCLNCFSVCSQTLEHCLGMGGKHSEQKHIQSLIDCIKICETSASFLARGSEAHHEICGICANICRECADKCSALEGEVMAKCAEVCIQCADSCEKMSAH